MRSSSRTAVRLAWLFGLLFLLVASSSCARDTDAEDRHDRAGSEAAAAGAAFDVVSERADSLIFEEKIAWARAQRLDTVEIGEAVVALGRSFVGTRYRPGTLE